jgi:hypothetical protein
MRNAAVLAFTVAALLTIAPGPNVAAQAGWTTLFDGTSLKGWNRVGDANWEVVDGTIQATKGATSFLVTPMSYGDFQMTFDIWVTNEANSGVFIRCQDPKTITAANAYEVNVYDQRPDPAYRTGAIVDVAKPMVQINAGGRWTTVDVTAQGSKLTVIMNGMKTVEVDHKAHARGPIALQYGSGTVRFRNVKIRTL